MDPDRKSSVVEAKKNEFWLQRMVTGWKLFFQVSEQNTDVQQV